MRLVALGAVAAALVAGAACAQPGGPQSAAVGIDAKLRALGIATELGPIAAVTGQAGGRYNDVVTVAKVSESAAFIGQLPPPTIFVTAQGLTSHAASSGFGIDSRSSEADTAIADAHIMLNLNPLPPGAAGQVPQPFLSIAAREVVASANFSIVFPAGSYVSGAASVGALTIGGQLLGGATVRYSGPAAPNTVIYETPTVTITLNRQMKVGLISCSPSCVFTPSRIDVAAVDIELNGAIIRGRKVFGDILIGEQSAQ